MRSLGKHVSSSFTRIFGRAIWHYFQEEQTQKRVRLTNLHPNHQTTKAHDSGTIKADSAPTDTKVQGSSVHMLPKFPSEASQGSSETEDGPAKVGVWIIS